MKENANVKYWGVGSLTVVISIFAMISTYGTINHGLTIGKYVFGTSIPYGTISFGLCCLSIYLGDKYNDDYGATLGLVIGKYNLILFMIGVVFTITLALFQ